MYGYSNYMELQEPDDIDIEFETHQLTAWNYIRFLDGYIHLCRTEERQQEDNEWCDWFMGVEKPVVKIAV